MPKPIVAIVGRPNEAHRTRSPGRSSPWSVDGAKVGRRRLGRPLEPALRQVVMQFVAARLVDEGVEHEGHAPRPRIVVLAVHADDLAPGVDEAPAPGQPDLDPHALAFRETVSAFSLRAISTWALAMSGRAIEVPR